MGMRSINIFTKSQNWVSLENDKLHMENYARIPKWWVGIINN